MLGLIVVGSSHKPLTLCFRSSALVMDVNRTTESTECEESFVVKFAQNSTQKEETEENAPNSGTDLQRAFLAFKKRRQVSSVPYFWKI